jgi:rhodanese-related sulfurtransferase
MPTFITDRDEVRRLMDAGAQIVEVLPREEYEELHLPGAILVPLRTVDAEVRRRLDPAKPVVVYCWDYV